MEATPLGTLEIILCMNLEVIKLAKRHKYWLIGLTK